MATGKSTVGPLLADALGYRFADLDWLVEARTGRRIAELFEEDGEAAFRAAEAGALAETTRGERLVVATGGGTLARPEGLAKARAAGAVVWLRMPTSALAARIEATHGARRRPLLADAYGQPLAGPALRERLRELLDAREPYYGQADVAVDASGHPHTVVREVAHALPPWPRRT